MSTTELPAAPLQAPLIDRSGLVTQVWADFFRQAVVRMGGFTATPNDQLAATPVVFADLQPTDWTSSQSTSGYQKLGSGLYVQWGVTASINSGTNAAQTFPIAFPTACLQVFPSVRDNSAVATSQTGHWGTGNYSTTGFDLYNRTSQAYVFNYLAVGK